MDFTLSPNPLDGTSLKDIGNFRLISKGRHEDRLKSLSPLRVQVASNPAAPESELSLMEDLESNL